MVFSCGPFGGPSLWWVESGGPNLVLVVQILLTSPIQSLWWSIPGGTKGFSLGGPIRGPTGGPLVVHSGSKLPSYLSESKDKFRS